MVSAPVGRVESFDAVTMFKKGVEADPGSGELRFNLAVAQLANGNKEGALSQYRVLKVEDAKLADQLYRILFHDKVIFVDGLERR